MIDFFTFIYGRDLGNAWFTIRSDKPIFQMIPIRITADGYGLIFMSTVE